MTDIPYWLIRAHRDNLFALQNCINNPSPAENELAIEMYKTLLSHDSGFSDFKYIILNEWWVNPNKPWLGKGDLAFTNGKNILVVEVKRIKGSTKQLKLQKLTKVIRQARYYALMIKKFRDRQRFPIPEYNQYFCKSKIHAAFYTNLDKNIILVKHPKRISSSNKKRLIDLPKNLTTQEVINTNKLNVELVEDQTPIHQKIFSSQVKIEENQTQQKQNIQLIKENNNQQQLFLVKQPNYKIIEESKDNEIIFIDHKINLQNTPQNKIKSSNSALKKFDDVITIKTDSKNRKFLVDSIEWDQKERIEISSDENVDPKKQVIIDQAIKPYFKNSTTANQNSLKNDIIFLNEIKPYKKQSPDLILLNSIQNKIQIPIQSESPKIIPFNMSLALSKNFDINCSLNQLSVPQQQKEVVEDDYCDVSLCSFIDIASFDLDNSYLQVKNNNHINNNYNRQSSILLGPYNNNQQLYQPLKDIVQQKLLEFNDSTQINNNLNENNKGLSQLEKIIIEQNDILVEINDSNKESKQKCGKSPLKQKDDDLQMLKNNFNTEQIINNQDQVIISQQCQEKNTESVIQIDALKEDCTEQNNNINNQNNKDEQKDQIENTNLIRHSEENQQIQIQSSQINLNDQQTHEYQNDSFYEFMLQQILIQEQIQEIYNEKEVLYDDKNIEFDQIDEQMLGFPKIYKNLFQKNTKENFPRVDKILQVNQLNAQNMQQMDILSEQEIQSDFCNIQNQEKKKKKKIIKINKNQFQDNIDEKNFNLNCIQDKIIELSQKSFKIIKKFDISKDQSASCYQQQIIPEQELRNNNNNYNYLGQFKLEKNQDIIQKSPSPKITQRIQNKMTKKIKIVKSDEIFKGKKINIVYKQPCREKKQQFIESM
ncbi:hypothetical protein TTHERM_00188310 (macronuclear) [Tetrahymena thermophila SB210]|uniref:Uncharacterized protein n=1 Tax=Tetrahymena thermophila (strain SB210) TaxID=312017 RepID=I7MJE4_TETTS|nr:hypothetical protein TTHERM_00188310 [Tetrahymena thermophila SB210]EAR96262.1 hypothetical protein TTHERM_00188310 [Tetrahymena thermophila SB210]|eukprot:XP_001016507.1 hypothetical protein TTHERM_00188310 [Tetrahymena thermophila SB210]